MDRYLIFVGDKREKEAKSSIDFIAGRPRFLSLYMFWVVMLAKHPYVLSIKFNCADQETDVSGSAQLNAAIAQILCRTAKRYPMNKSSLAKGARQETS